MRIRRVFLALVFLPAFLLAAFPAAQADDSADAFIRDAGNRAFTSLGGELSDDERAERFRAILRDTFDLNTIGRFTLGRYWRVASAEQRDEYRRLFEAFLVKAYANRFRDLGGKQFKIARTQQINKRDKLVQSEIEVAPGKPPVRVGWRVRNKNEQLKIIDVMVEGISMSVTQRDEFAAVIRSKGGKVEGLLSALRSKTGQ